jgi:hypothetical protein
MRRFLLFSGIAASLLLGSALAHAQPQGKFGAGFIVGEPVGISWKYRTSYTNAFDGALGFLPDHGYRVHVDYLWQSYPFDEQNLAVHYGAGMAVGSGRSAYFNNNGTFFRNQEVGFGLRGVLGLNYLIRKTPLDLFVEFAPLIVLTPNSGSGVDLGFGARVYF